MRGGYGLDRELLSRAGRHLGRMCSLRLRGVLGREVRCRVGGEHQVLMCRMRRSFLPIIGRRQVGVAGRDRMYRLSIRIRRSLLLLGVLGLRLDSGRTGLRWRLGLLGARIRRVCPRRCRIGGRSLLRCLGIRLSRVRILLRLPRGFRSRGRGR